jgi:hypothetical protein
MVNDVECSGGKSAEGRVKPPIVSYRPDSVVIAVFVKPLPPGG